MSLPVPFVYKSPIKSNLVPIRAILKLEVPPTVKEFLAFGVVPMPTCAVDAVPIFNCPCPKLCISINVSKFSLLELRHVKVLFLNSQMP